VPISHKVYSSRALNIDSDTYIGEEGRLFYAQTTATGLAPVLKYSDGVTPGGLPLTGTAFNILPANANGVLYDDGAGHLSWIGLGAFQGPPGPAGQNGITSLSLGTGLAGNLNTTTGLLSLSATGIQSLVGTANQVIVTDLGNQSFKLSTPQNLNTTATVQFGNLTVNNISILGTSTNLTSIEIQGYRLYLASSATNLSQINGGGVQLGTTATGVHSIFWNSGGYWDTDSDGIKTLTLEATTSTLGTLEVLNGAVFGYVNQDLTLANAYIQVNSNVNNFSQIAIINHNTGTNASADIVATNDTGNDSSGFIDMGINSSVFSTSSWIINGANDGYLYVAGGNLAIGTDQVGGEIKTFLGTTDNPTVISVANASTITYSVDLMPGVDAQYLLGRPGQRWKGIYVGTGSVWINDISLGTDAELTVDNGVLYVNGAYQLQVGQLKFFENTIESTTGAIDIQIGQTKSTANLVLNRNVVLAAGKTLSFGTGTDATIQTVAFNSSTAVTTIVAGTGTHVSTATGVVTVWVDLLSGPTGLQGSTGAQGVQGTTGTNGTNGAQGTSGSNGAQGTSGTNGAQGTTGTKGTDGSSVRIIGSTSTATTLAFTAVDPSPTIGDGIIVSSSGHLWTYTGSGPVNGFADVGNVTGPQGAQGASGSQGAVGNNGVQGTTGSQGTVGNTGNQGTAGNNGNNGAQGTTGSQGTAGSQGVNGSTGVQGTAGNNGNNGAQGTIGTQGSIGTQGTLGTQGTVGTTGGQGVQGTIGSIGFTGLQGSTGVQGITGSFTGSVVTSITAGTGTAITTSTGAVTIWAIPQAITSTTGTSTATNLTVDLSGPTFVHWQPSANGSRTITLTGFAPGRKTEVFITPHATADVFTVSGVTASQCSNNKNTFTIQGVGASAQTSFMLQIYSTTNDVGGVWIFGSSSV